SKIRRVLIDRELDPRQIDLSIEAGGDISIMLKDLRVLTVNDRDSKIFGKSREELAERWSALLRSRLTQLQPLYNVSSQARTTSQKSHSETSSTSKPLSEHRVLLFLIQVAALLF